MTDVEKQSSEQAQPLLPAETLRGQSAQERPRRLVAAPSPASQYLAMPWVALTPAI